MTDLNFTDDEAQMVEAMARDRHGIVSRLGFYMSVLVPVAIFGGYGIVNHDFLATVVALVGLSIFVAWRISNELTRLDVYKSVCRKVAQHENESRGRAQQIAAADRANRSRSD